MARGRRDSVLERAWRGRVAGWATSGLGVRAFCRQQGLSEASFHFWKRELRARDAAAGGRTAARSMATKATSTCSPEPNSASTNSAVAKSGSAPPLFVPLTVLPDAAAARARLPETIVPAAVCPAATLAVEVRCPSGHVVCLPSCEVSALASLFAALHPPAGEEPSC